MGTDGACANVHTNSISIPTTVTIIALHSIASSSAFYQLTLHYIAWVSIQLASSAHHHHQQQHHYQRRHHLWFLLLFFISFPIVFINSNDGWLTCHFVNIFCSAISFLALSLSLFSLSLWIFLFPAFFLVGIILTLCLLLLLRVWVSECSESKWVSEWVSE